MAAFPPGNTGQPSPDPKPDYTLGVTIPHPAAGTAAASAELNLETSRSYDFATMTDEEIAADIWAQAKPGIMEALATIRRELGGTS